MLNTNNPSNVTKVRLFKHNHCLESMVDDMGIDWVLTAIGQKFVNQSRDLKLTYEESDFLSDEYAHGLRGAMKNLCSQS